METPRQPGGRGLFSLMALGPSPQVKKDSANQHPKMEGIQFQGLVLVGVSLTGYLHHQQAFSLPVPREWGPAELPGLAFPHCAGLRALPPLSLIHTLYSDQVIPPSLRPSTQHLPRHPHSPPPTANTLCPQPSLVLLTCKSCPLPFSSGFRRGRHVMSTAPHPGPPPVPAPRPLNL